MLYFLAQSNFDVLLHVAVQALQIEMEEKKAGIEEGTVMIGRAVRAESVIMTTIGTGAEVEVERGIVEEIGNEIIVMIIVTGTAIGIEIVIDTGTEIYKMFAL